MTPAQWSALSPAERAAYAAQYGPPPAHYQQTANPYPTAAAPAVIPAPKRRRRWPWVVGALMLLIVVIGSTSNGHSTGAVGPQPAAPAAAAAQPASDAQPAAPAGPATSVGDGTYQVGTDLAAGRYKTAGPGGHTALDICYWERDSNDSGQFDAIISNDVFKGPGSVTVKDGEFVKLTGGCTWTKQ